MSEFWSRKMKEREHLEHLGLGGRIILKRILKKYAGRL